MNMNIMQLLQHNRDCSTDLETLLQELSVQSKDDHKNKESSLLL